MRCNPINFDLHVFKDVVLSMLITEPLCYCCFRYPPFGKNGEESGYENCEFFAGSEDSLLHIMCTWDGGTLGPPGLPRGPHPHFIVDLKQVRKRHFLSVFVSK